MPRFHKVYACHDHLLTDKEALFDHAVGRWGDLFNASFELASLGFAQNFGSGGEAEGLHFVRVLSLGEEFREDVALGGIHEKFWPAVA